MRIYYVDDKYILKSFKVSHEKGIEVEKLSPDFKSSEGYIEVLLALEELFNRDIKIKTKIKRYKL